MIDLEDVKVAVEEAMGNEQFRVLYEGAPSVASKEHYALMAWLMKHNLLGDVDSDEFRAANESVMGRFTLEDWIYVRDNTPPNNKHWRRCDNMVKKMQGGGA